MGVKEMVQEIPQIQYQTVEKFVDVPHIQTVERVVEVPKVQVQEIEKRVPIYEEGSPRFAQTFDASGTSPSYATPPYAQPAMTVPQPAMPVPQPNMTAYSQPMTAYQPMTS